MKRILSLLLCAVLVLSLAACSRAAAPETPPTIPVTEVPTEPPTETQAPTEPTAPETEPYIEPDYDIIVSTAFSQSVTVDDMTMEYAIPYISVNGEPVETVNTQIWEDLYLGYYLPMVEEAMEADGIPSLSQITYFWSEGNGILSVVGCISSYYTATEWFPVYNVLLEEGRAATREEVLSAFGYDEASFQAQARDVLGTRFISENRYMLETYADEEDVVEGIYSLLDETVTPENVAAAIPYAGPDGNLFLVGTVYCMAGAGRYDCIMSMSAMIDPDYTAIMEQRG